MPRKKEGMPFEVYPGPNKAENGEKLLYVKPKSGMKRTLQELEDFYSYKFSFRKGDMTRLFEAFIEMSAKAMAQGYRIETPIGTFAPKLRFKRNLVEKLTNPDEVKHNDVELEGIDCKLSKKYKKELKIEIGAEGFRYVRKAMSSRILINQQHLEEALQKSLKYNKGYTTVYSFAIYSGLTEYSARKQLNHWCYGEHPRLQRSRVSRAVIYTEI